MLRLLQYRNTFQLTRRHFSTPNSGPNQVVFNKINEFFVVRGKEKLVGAWLLTVSASVFGMVILGGYTRLEKAGLSMTKWHPHRVMPPRTREQWEKEFEEYKQYPEYKVVHKDITLEGFKRIYYIEWAHRILGRSLALIYFLPFGYFHYKGYIQPQLRGALIFVTGLGLAQGFFGWWMVKSGLKDKAETKELDKTPRVSPYRFALHAGIAYLIYGTLLYNALHLVRRPQEAITNLKNLSEMTQTRKLLFKFSHYLFPFVLITGYFTAGTQARYACNTFPMVGSSVFIMPKHFNKDIPLWKNFTENKLVVQVTHRTLATVFVVLGALQLHRILKFQTITPICRMSVIGLLAVLWGQLAIGVSAVWFPSPLHLASLHQIGAMGLMTATVFALHTCRKVDPRHIRNMMLKLNAENPQAFRQRVKEFDPNMWSKKDFEAAVKLAEELPK